MHGCKLIYRVLNVHPYRSFLTTTTRIKKDVLACKNHFSSFLRFDSNTAAGNEFPPSRLPPTTHSTTSQFNSCPWLRVCREGETMSKIAIYTIISYTFMHPIFYD